VTHVAAHKATLDYSNEELNQDLVRLTTTVLKNVSRDMSDACAYAATSAIASGAWGTSIGQPVTARRLFEIGTDYAIGAFRSFGRPGEAIEFPLEGVVIHASGVEPTTRAPKHVDWIECLSMALCLRRADALAVLARFPIDLLERRRDQFWGALCLALQRFLQEDPLWTELDAQATALAQAAQTETPKTVARYMSILPALRAVAAADQTAFTEALVHMLQAHKAQESRGQFKNTGPSLLALPACGMAALGVQRGLRLEVESGYMPAWLVNNEAP
jgi:hypothetical protein